MKYRETKRINPSITKEAYDLIQSLPKNQKGSFISQAIVKYFEIENINKPYLLNEKDSSWIIEMINFKVDKELKMVYEDLAIIREQINSIMEGKKC